MLDTIKMLPRQYRKDAWLLALLQALETRDAQQLETIRDIAAQVFLDTMTWNLKNEEQLAGIAPAANASVTDRKNELSAKWRTRGKVTETQLQRIADAWENGTVKVGYDGKVIHLVFNGVYGVPVNVDALKQAIDRAKPAHLPVDYAYQYLLVRDVQGMTVSELQTQEIHKFAFARRDGI